MLWAQFHYLVKEEAVYGRDCAWRGVEEQEVYSHD